MSYYRNTGSGGYYRPSFFRGGFRFFPPVIKWLIISNVGIWLLLSFFLAQFTIGRAGHSIEKLQPNIRSYEILSLYRKKEVKIDGTIREQHTECDQYPKHCTRGSNSGCTLA